MLGESVGSLDQESWPVAFATPRQGMASLEVWASVVVNKADSSMLKLIVCIALGFLVSETVGAEFQH